MKNNRPLSHKRYFKHPIICYHIKIVDRSRKWPCKFSKNFLWLWMKKKKKKRESFDIIVVFFGFWFDLVWFVFFFLIQFCSFISGRNLKYVSPEGLWYFFKWLNYYYNKFWWYGIATRLFCYLNFDYRINIFIKSCKLFLELHDHFFGLTFIL